MTTRARAEWLRLLWEKTTGDPYYVVPLGEWRADPLDALQRAETARFATS